MLNKVYKNLHYLTIIYILQYLHDLHTIIISRRGHQNVKIKNFILELSLTQYYKTYSNRIYQSIIIKSRLCPRVAQSCYL